MIGSFADEEAQAIFERRSSRRFGPLNRVVLRKLLQIDAAISLDKLTSPPGNHLEALQGDRKGQHSIRINRQYRICFEWKDGYAYNVEVDYH